MRGQPDYTLTRATLSVPLPSKHLRAACQTWRCCGTSTHVSACAEVWDLARPTLYSSRASSHELTRYESSQAFLSLKSGTDSMMIVSSWMDLGRKRGFREEFSITKAHGVTERGGGCWGKKMVFANSGQISR
jgi:hypothetical protein